MFPSVIYFEADYSTDYYGHPEASVAISIATDSGDYEYRHLLITTSYGDGSADYWTDATLFSHCLTQDS